MPSKATKRKIAGLFWTGRSQAVRLPKEFRFNGDKVLVHREGNAVILEPSSDWPEGYLRSIERLSDDFERPPQGALEKRRKL